MQAFARKEATTLPRPLNASRWLGVQITKLLQMNAICCADALINELPASNEEY